MNHLLKKLIYKEETAFLLDKFKSIQVECWNSEYTNTTICHGTQWKFFVKNKDQRSTIWEGSNAYPYNWDELLSFLVSIMMMSENLQLGEGKE